MLEQGRNCTPSFWHDAVIIVTVNNVSLPYFVASIEMIENP